MANLRTNNLSGEQGQNAYRGSVQFNDADYLQIADSADIEFGSGDYTVEFWAIFTKVSSSTAYEEIVNKGYPFQIYRNTSNNQILLAVDSDASSSYDINATFGTAHRGHWHHIAVSRSGNTTKAFLNGIGGLSSTSSTSINDTGSAFTIGAYADSLGSYKFRGVISNVRVVIGTALYTADFTPPTEELTIVDGTAILCCQDSNDPTQEATGKTITAGGSLATAGYLETQPKVIPPYGVDAGNAFGGPIQQSTQGYMYFPTGRTEERGRGRAIFMGGSIHPVSPSYTANIDYVEMTTSGVAVRFGSLTAATQQSASFASSTRGISAGGQTGSPDTQTNVIEFVTISTEGNATNFGDLDTAHRRLGGQGHSNQTRGIVAGGGGDSPAQTNVIQFVTIASTGDATNFGDLLNAKDNSMAKNGSSTRMLICGGRDYTPSATNTNVIEFVTIATTGDSQNFGDLSAARNGGTGCSSGVRGVIAGGRTPTMLNTIDFVTIASAGDATDFGDLTEVNAFLGGANNSIRGIFACGSTPTKISTIQTINIATTGNATAYGANTVTDPVTSRGTCSDSHGGLS